MIDTIDTGRFGIRDGSMNFGFGLSIKKEILTFLSNFTFVSHMLHLMSLKFVRTLWNQEHVVRTSGVYTRSPDTMTQGI